VATNPVKGSQVFLETGTGLSSVHCGPVRHLCTGMLVTAQLHCFLKIMHIKWHILEHFGEVLLKGNWCLRKSTSKLAR